MNKIIKFIILYSSINFIFFIISGFFSMKAPFLPPILIQIIILGIVFVIIKKDLIKSDKIFVLLVLYILGGIICVFNFFAASIEYIWAILSVAYFSVVTFLVWKGKVVKFIWILILILFIQFCVQFIPSKACSLQYKGGIVYSCECKGLKKRFLGSTSCIGERTCYKYDEKVSWTNDETKKQKVDCFEVDNYKPNQ